MIIIYASPSGAGKTTSTRTFFKGYREDGKDFSKDVGFLLVEKNRLPFRDEGQAMLIKDADYDMIMRVLRNPTLNCYIIDDSQFLMAHELFNRVHEKGYDKFTDMAKHFYDLLNWINHNVPEDVNVYFLHHTETLDDGTVKLKTCGKMLDEKYPIEGVVNIILQGEVNQNGYFCRTKNRSRDIAKTPLGMFEQDLIPNDLYAIDKTIREYYGLKPITDHPAPKTAPQVTNQAKVSTASTVPPTPGKTADKKAS